MVVCLRLRNFGSRALYCRVLQDVAGCCLWEAESSLNQIVQNTYASRRFAGCLVSVKALPHLQILTTTKIIEWATCNKYNTITNNKTTTKHPGSPYAYRINLLKRDLRSSHAPLSRPCSEVGTAGIAVPSETRASAPHPTRAPSEAVRSAPAAGAARSAVLQQVRSVEARMVVRRMLSAGALEAEAAVALAPVAPFPAQAVVLLAEVRLAAAVVLAAVVLSAEGAAATAVASVAAVRLVAQAAVVAAVALVARVAVVAVVHSVEGMTEAATAAVSVVAAAVVSVVAAAAVSVVMQAAVTAAVASVARVDSAARALSGVALVMRHRPPWVHSGAARRVARARRSPCGAATAAAASSAMAVTA